MPWKNDLKKRLAEDMEKGLADLEGRIRDESPEVNPFILLRSRYRNLLRERMQGTISDEAYRLERNRVQLALFDLIDRLDASPSMGKSPLPAKASGERSRDWTVFPWKEHHPFYIETFESPRDGNPVFSDFQDEVWQGVHDHGLFSLINRSSPSSVQYHYLNVDDLDMAAHPVSVEVRVRAPGTHPPSSAGLIYCFQPTTRHYYLYTIGPDQEFQFRRKDFNGYVTLFAGRSAAVREEGFNKLALIKNEDRFYLFINDAFVKGIQDATLSRGDAGIIALGQGNFSFDNLAFYRIS